MKRSAGRVKVVFGFVLSVAVSLGTWSRLPLPQRPCNAPVRAEDGTLHGLGLVYQDPRTIEGWRQAPLQPGRTTETLPPSVVNTAYLPPVGDQGAQFSCVAWATAYTTLTYMEAKAHDRAPAAPGQIMSPAYVYNQGHLQPDGSMSFSDATALLTTLGCASLEQMPYTQQDDTAWPSESAYKEAMRYRVLPGSVTWVDTTQPGGLDAVKQWLAQGNIGFAGMWLYGNFNNIRNYSDNYCLADVPSGGLTQYLAHATAIIGYDDSRITDDGVGAFRCVNSWGTGWGDQGYYWLSYQAAADPNQKIFQGFFAYYRITSGAPTYAGVFQISYPRARDLLVTLSSGASSIHPWRLASWADPTSRNTSLPAPPHRVWVDLSDLAGPSGPFPLSFSVTDGFDPEDSGRIESLAVVDLATGQMTVDLDLPVTIAPLGPPQLVTNGGFESGLAGWSPWRWQGGSMPVASSDQAHGGSASAYLLAGGSSPGEDGIDRVLTFPNSPTALVFWYAPFCQGSSVSDYQVAGFNDDQGDLLALLLYLHADTQAWTPVYVDLGPYAGQTVHLNFSVSHDGTPGAWTALYVDDVGLCPEVPAVATLDALSAPPPAVGSVTKLASPFRLKLTGSGFQNGIAVAIGDTPWSGALRKSDGTIVLKGGASLKALFPKGQSVPIELLNPDGGGVETSFTR